MAAALRDNGAIIIYPEGTTTREPNLWPMRGKTGAARLALATGAPMIPVVMWGPQHMFDPRTREAAVAAPDSGHRRGRSADRHEPAGAACRRQRRSWAR